MCAMDQEECRTLVGVFQGTPESAPPHSGFDVALGSSRQGCDIPPVLQYN